jgi:hypothetical protein
MPQAAAATKTKAIKATCEHCGKTIRVPASYAGKKGKCPKCMGVVRIPGGRSRSSKEARRPRSRRKPERKTVPCPSCSEEIRPGALKCRHCGEWFGDCDAGGRSLPTPDPGMSVGTKIRLGLLCFKLVVIAFFVLTN